MAASQVGDAAPTLTLNLLSFTDPVSRQGCLVLYKCADFIFAQLPASLAFQKDPLLRGWWTLP